MHSFATYAYSCRIFLLEFLLFLGLNTITNSSFYGGNVLHVLVLFFFSLPLISTLVPACISYNLTAATKFSCCSSNQKKCLPVISLALFLVELRWPGAYFLVFSFFLLYFKFVDLTIKLSLRASLCKILISSFAHNMDFAHNFSVDFF